MVGQCLCGGVAFEFDGPIKQHRVVRHCFFRCRLQLVRPLPRNSTSTRLRFDGSG